VPRKGRIAALVGAVVAVVAFGSEVAQVTGYNLRDVIESVVVRHSPSPSPPPTAAPVPHPRPGSRTVLAVHPHLMRDRDWADPAVLETWLDFDHAGSLPADEAAAQRRLWDYEAAHNGGFTASQWEYSPYAVARTFDDFAGRAAVGDRPFDDASSAGAAISDSVSRRHEPVIALVDDARSYVLISGVTLGPGGATAPPDRVVVDDPWPVDAYGPTRNEGSAAALGQDRDMTWQEFLAHFTPVPSSLPGVWSGRWVLVAAGQPLVS
jgi:hypothetical protein